MITLKEYINKSKKEDIYAFYTKVINKPKEYNKISRNDIYNNIISLYNDDPEIILKLCSAEEITILKNIINNNVYNKNGGYIEYLLIKNLKDNYLIIGENEYYIPEDLINYIKMALNLYDEKIYSLSDVTDSVILGLIRIYNCLSLKEFKDLLENYYINISIDELKKMILNNIKFKNLISIIKYNKKEYIISLKNLYYKDIIKLNKENINIQKYVLEEVISFGKYKINLFNEEIFKFLSFLEVHLENKYINLIIDDLIVYAGFDINDEEVLYKIADNIQSLFNQIKKVVVYFPIWIYKGNNLITLKDNFILPDNNASCICGSGKKFKHCCKKFYK